MPKIIGRTKESKILEELYKSREAQFLAIYGRRRVGKTFLIHEYFTSKGIYFEVTGLKKGTMYDQLENFMDAFSDTFYPGIKLQTPKRWRDAFSILTDEIQKTPKTKKIILFFDELPWLATKRSKLISMLDYFWNTHWSKMRNVIVIVCGSAASWMISKIVNAKGGLHNRLTQKILLEPFRLNQAKKFLESRQIKLSNKQILDIYMVTGGIAFYLKAVKKGQSATQAINKLCFDKNGLLFSEFENLFASLFEAAELNKAIVKAIANKRNGISRNELLKILGLKSGSVIKDRLIELIAAGFIQRFTPYGKKRKDHYYRVIDEYTQFYIRWIEQFTLNPRSLPRKGYWQTISQTPQYYSWAGYAFEEVCYKHIDEIAAALDIEDTIWYTSSWQHITKKDGAQIDLLFDRSDDVITLCEIKYSSNKFLIDKAYAKNLMNKVDVFEKYCKPTKDIQIALITVSGLKTNLWSQELVQAEVTLDDLFSEN